MMLKKIKEQLQNLDKRTYLVHQLDPKFENLEYMKCCTEDNYIKIFGLFDNLDNIIKIKYDSITELHIDSINVYIELKSGQSYYFKEKRNNLVEIFADFKKHDLDVSIDKFYIIKDYSIVGQDDGTYILRGMTVYEEDEELEENEYKDFRYKLKFDNIVEIDEDYEEGYHHLQLKLINGEYIEFEAEW
ncbi:hypothetical protein ACFHWD_03470 [Clostridium sp. MT-14]|uniref:hypothetical protein n=1 Tax=Clostridium sp. MT-14 TaxID=3348360 RepID=UPI0035F364FE